VLLDDQGRQLHSHDGLKPHFHEPIYSPGEFRNRPQPLARNFKQRSFTIGIGGPVGTGCAPPLHSPPLSASGGLRRWLCTLRVPCVDAASLYTRGGRVGDVEAH
jgi:hypothetical protein